MSNGSQIPKTRKNDTPLLDRDEAWKRLIDRCAALEASNQSLQHQLREAVEALESVRRGEMLGGELCWCFDPDPEARTHEPACHKARAVIESYRKMHG
jgi:hypothetical protein